MTAHSELFSFFFLMIRRPPRSPLFPSTPLFRSRVEVGPAHHRRRLWVHAPDPPVDVAEVVDADHTAGIPQNRKSTRLNSSHSQISYAVFCLKKKKNKLRYSIVLGYKRGCSQHNC